MTMTATPAAWVTVPRSRLSLSANTSSRPIWDPHASDHRGVDGASCLTRGYPDSAGGFGTIIGPGTHWDGARDMFDELGKIGVWRSAAQLSPELAVTLERLGYGAIWIAGSPAGDLRLALR